ncbi:MAG: 4Fe-4S binding protein [Bacteroidales bacterium]|nr:4Fe-4S binding protein [Bacteroidales bacterium]
MGTMRVTALYFSPTHTTRKVVEAMAEGAAAKISDGTYSKINVTTPLQRRETPVFGKGDLVIFGVPVYIGRVPNLLRDYFASIKGNGAIGVPVAVYGNRAYDDALIELRDIMHSNGFHCIAAGAFIGEHSFSYTLGGGRPDAGDLLIARNFGSEIGTDIMQGEDLPELVEVPGNPYPYKFYNAKSSSNSSIDIRKVKPETDPEKCTSCGLCAMLCPMGAIDPTNCALVPGICIKCGACIKMCRPKAKYFSDPTYLEHKEILEKNFTEPRKEPELFR